MQITLIYPGKLDVSTALYPPLGIGYIASHLKSNGFPVKLLDMNFDNILQTSPTPGKTIYGIYATTPLYTHGIQIAKKIREIDKEAIIIFGGPHPTVLPHDTIRDGADIVVVGEGEGTFLSLAKAIRDNKSLDTVNGIVYSHDGEITTTPHRGFIRNLDNLPFPDQSLFQTEKYFELKGYRELSIITSRGCPMNCTFCQPTLRKLFGNKTRYRSPENVVDEIEYLVNDFKLDMIVFSDDTFCVNEQHVIDICNLIIKRKINILWRCQTRVGLKKETMKLMKQSGCFLMAMGVESGSQKILNGIRKGITIRQIVDTFKLCKQVGILTHAFLMVGNIGETRETIRQTKELMRTIKPFNIYSAITTPYPGTDLYDDAVKKDMLIETPWSEFAHHQKGPIMKLDDLSREEILNIRDELFDFHKTQASSKASDIIGCMKDFVLVRKIILMTLRDVGTIKRLFFLTIRAITLSGFKITNPTVINNS